MRNVSRRQFLRGLGAAPLVPAFLSSFHELAATERKRAKIRDVQVMVMQGPSRTYTLIKITSDAGLYGIAEGYGTPGVGVKEQVLSLKPWLIGKDPLEMVFIRAPKIERVGNGVEILAREGDDPVLVRQGKTMAATFHPELSDDTRVHGEFLKMLNGAK